MARGRNVPVSQTLLHGFEKAGGSPGHSEIALQAGRAQPKQEKHTCTSEVRPVSGRELEVKCQQLQPHDRLTRHNQAGLIKAMPFVTVTEATGR